MTTSPRSGLGSFVPPHRFGDPDSDDFSALGAPDWHAVDHRSLGLRTMDAESRYDVHVIEAEDGARTTESIELIHPRRPAITRMAGRSPPSDRTLNEHGDELLRTGSAWSRSTRTASSTGPSTSSSRPTSTPRSPTSSRWRRRPNTRNAGTPRTGWSTRHTPRTTGSRSSPTTSPPTTGGRSLGRPRAGGTRRWRHSVASTRSRPR